MQLKEVTQYFLALLSDLVQPCHTGFYNIALSSRSFSCRYRNWRGSLLVSSRSCWARRMLMQRPCSKLTAATKKHKTSREKPILYSSRHDPLSPTSLSKPVMELQFVPCQNLSQTPEAPRDPDISTGARTKKEGGAAQPVSTGEQDCSQRANGGYGRQVTASAGATKRSRVSEAAPAGERAESATRTGPNLFTAISNPTLWLLRSDCKVRYSDLRKPDSGKTNL